MENASKALIIAGAILLAILIISLGIMIYNQAAGVVNNNSMSEVEISTFNQKFMQYEGTNVRGAQVNALLNAVVQSNLANQDDNSKLIEISVTATSWQGSKPSGNVLNNSFGKAQVGQTYNVKCDVNKKTGLVNKVIISDISSTLNTTK